MAVVDEAWLAVWWPWLLVWVATAGLLAAAGVIVAAHWRRATRGPRLDTSVYLARNQVMALYLQHGPKYRAALEHEVQERISSVRHVGTSTQLSVVEANAKREVTEEVFRKYIEQAQPITVISMVIDALRRADAIVEVDLDRQEIEPSASLPEERPIRLGKVRGIVSISGWFEVIDQDDRSTTLEAAFGGTDDPAGRPRVRVVCAEGDVSFDPGWARCLGRVGKWDARTRTLPVRPIAVFQ